MGNAVLARRCTATVYDRDVQNPAPGCSTVFAVPLGQGGTSMYRIELGPDDIGVFRSIEEMATAIKTGVLTPKARIFHSASDKWLPIEFHPHYKKAREMAAG